MCLNSLQNYFNIQVLFSGNDYTQPIVAQLVVCNSENCLINLISGIQEYSTNPYFLKKKNLGEIINYQPGSPLSFLISLSDLDSIYNSSSYSTNQQISIGDLDF